MLHIHYQSGSIIFLWEKKRKVNWVQGQKSRSNQCCQIRDQKKWKGTLSFKTENHKCNTLYALYKYLLSEKWQQTGWMLNKQLCLLWGIIGWMIKIDHTSKISNSKLFICGSRNEEPLILLQVFCYLLNCVSPHHIHVLFFHSLSAS